MVSSRHRWAARLLAALLAAVTLPVVATPAATATPPGPKDVTATLFQWRFEDVARACTDVLGPKGYGYVEVSPATEHIQGPQWWTVYQPVSYRIAGRLGDRAAFANMVTTCHNAGVKVIADAVINHMAGISGGVGTGGTQFSKYTYPGHYQDWDFHSCRQPITDYRNRGNVQNCELVHLSDLDTGSEYVRSEIAEYLDDLRSLGVDGFRIDAAKHIAAADLAAIKSRQRDPGYWVQEVIYGAGEAVQPEEYLGTGDVDEFRYATGLKSAFTDGRLADLSQFGPAWGFVPSAQARSFVDNWDTERNGSTLNRTYGSTYTLANVFMLAWPYGSPNVYSGYEFSGHDDGPPLGGDVRACFQDGWTCQHAWRQIANMVGFRNAVSGTGVTNWWSNGNDAIAFGRGAKGYVVINREPTALTRTFQTSLPAGSYCDVQRADPGACAGNTHTIGADGRFTATVGPGEALALYTTSAAPTSGADFAVTATTTWGQNIFVVGNHPALGNWSPSAAIPLSPATYPTWRGSITLPAGTTFEYKYLRKADNGTVTWESGPNRTATVPTTSRATLTDTWRP
ncbi:carbohydrate-binding module family 20 domain-containing protein [Actinokineospora sp. NPDC004072]